MPEVDRCGRASRRSGSLIGHRLYASSLQPKQRGAGRHGLARLHATPRSPVRLAAPGPRSASSSPRSSGATSPSATSSPTDTATATISPGRVAFTAVGPLWAAAAVSASARIRSRQELTVTGIRRPRSVTTQCAAGALDQDGQRRRTVDEPRDPAARVGHLEPPAVGRRDPLVGDSHLVVAHRRRASRRAILPHADPSATAGDGVGLDRRRSPGGPAARRRPPVRRPRASAHGEPFHRSAIRPVSYAPRLKAASSTSQRRKPASVWTPPTRVSSSARRSRSTRRRPILGMDHQLGEQRVVLRSQVGVGLDACVDPDSRARRASARR